MTSPAPSDQTPDDKLADERRRAGREASILLVLLSETPDDPALKARIDSWCAQSPLHREVWERTRRTYLLIGGSPAVHGAKWKRLAAGRAAPPEPAPAALATHQPQLRRARGLLVAATLAVAACLAMVVAPVAYIRLQADMVTATADVRTIDLEDGSRVRLAPQSAIGFAFSDGERRVRLLKGEAFFDVAPDTRRPFRVVAGDVTATVLGTAFEVALQEDGAAVAVRHGKVRVDDARTSPPLSETLQAGDWVRVKGRAARRGSTPRDDIGDWTAGQFVARDRPIGEIVDRLRGYYDGAIVLQDSAFAGRLVSGVYDLRDPETTLRNLASAHNAVVRRISPWLLLVTAR
jgi:transmembrane sensor